MNSAELIRYVFDGADGEVVVFDTKTDAEALVDIKAGNLADALPENPALIMELAGYAYGAVIPSPDHATFVLTKGDKSIYVALLKEPLALESLRADVRTDIPMDWDYMDMAGEFIEDIDSIYPAEALGAEEEGTPRKDGEPQLEPAYCVPLPEESEAEGVPKSAEADGSADCGSVEVAVGSGPPSSAAGPSGSEKLHDAILLGEEPEGLGDFFAKSATLLTGELWGAKDRRNTQDGDWKSITLPWGAWIAGGGKAKGKPAWGFSHHPEGKDKAGASIVLGSSIGGARKAQAMDEMYALGLDIDSGAKLDDVVDKILERKLLALIYTSHSHGKSGLEIKRDEVMRKVQAVEDPTLPQIQEYLRSHSKSRYEESFINQVRIEDGKRQTKEGVQIVLSTPPLDKFRIIFPMENPVKLIDLAPTQQAALEVWEDKITGMAWEELGVHFDTSCTDPSRLFYTARHAKDAEWDCMVLRGAPLNFDDVPTYKKHLYTKHRAKLNPWEIAGDEGDEKRIPDCYTPSGKSLNDWHRHAKDRFQMATLLEDMVPDKIRHAGGEAEGHVHVECPFEYEHSKEGGTGTMAIDALDSNSDYWTIFCHHDSCQDRHKLEFLQEMLNQGWFEEDVLFDEDSMYFLEPGEAVEEKPKEAPTDETGGEITLESRAEAFNKSSKAKEIEEFIDALFLEGVDVTDRARVNDILSVRTVLGKRDLNKMWQALDRVQRRIDADKARTGDIEDSGKMMIDADFFKQVDYGGRRLKDTNHKNPFLFRYAQDKASVDEDADGLPFIKFVDQTKFTYFLNTHTRYYQKVGEDGKRHVSVPNDVSKHLFAAPNDYPPLMGLTNTPVFASNGKLIREEGYDADSGLFYHAASGVSIPEVSATPSEEDVEEAKRLLVVELLGDFPFAAKSRRELIDEGLYGDGVPALTNLIAFFLLPFFRELLAKGAVAPGLLVTKPSPGSGASLLVDVYAIVTGGRSASPLAIPENNDEMKKLLGSVVPEGRPLVYFDNINNNINSGELASAMTADRYAARILGKSQTVDVPVRSAFIFTGNNVMMSGELVRRMVLSDLDARLANPALRTGWRHENIKEWAMDNRGELVWACLTLIANWVAQGSPEQKDVTLASYEDFCAKIGGVLKSAGLHGFLGNVSELHEKATEDEGDEFEILVEAWWDHCGTRAIYSKGTEKDQGLCEIAQIQEISLAVRKERGLDGDLTYTGRGMGKLLTQNKDRIFVLEDGSEVTVRRESKRTKRGHPYYLELNQKAPRSNA